MLVRNLYLHKGLKTTTNYIDKYKRFSIIYIFFKEELITNFWRWIVVIVAQQCDCT